MILSTLLLTALLPAALSATLSKAIEGAQSDRGSGKIWAVLVAGSKTYENYRHQANICHAYQIFHRHGIPDENIIVMMYDDIAYNRENPLQGQLFNKPNGPNVYGPKAVPKDYTGDEVNPKNFLQVLLGNSTGLKGSGKVLHSGPDDHVFINFVDHGAQGNVAFPKDVLYADDLMNTLLTMHKNKMYKKLLFYMEACESGSMFQNLLPTDVNIIAVSAARPDESSFGCYCGKAKYDFTCLGSQFSVAWMEDIDSEEGFKNQTTETLWTQYRHVSKVVKDSHPTIYGNMLLDQDHAKDYFGVKDTPDDILLETVDESLDDVVPNRDVGLYRLNLKIKLTSDLNELEQLKKKKENVVQGRKTIDQLFSEIVIRLQGMSAGTVDFIENSKTELSWEMMPCYKTLVNGFRSQCVNINENTYAMGHLYKFANLCNVKDVNIEKALQTFSEVCNDEHRSLIGAN